MFAAAVLVSLAICLLAGFRGLMLLVSSVIAFVLVELVFILVVDNLVRVPLETFPSNENAPKTP